MNTFGTTFRLTSFGESHGKAVGGIIDGMIAGIPVDEAFIQNELDRRRPGRNSCVTSRTEADTVHILSGVFDGFTLGTPIGFFVENTNQHSADYDKTFRPSHADYTYYNKYGGNWDYRGGGRASARETLSRVVAGAFAKLALRELLPGLRISAYLSAVGQVSIPYSYDCYDLTHVDESPIFCPDKAFEAEFKKEIDSARQRKDTLGSVVTCVCSCPPRNLGEPIFDKAHAVLASAMMSVPGAKGFEYGMGFCGSKMNGSEVLDEFGCDNDGHISVMSNHSGGIQGGITNGSDIYFNVAFKPIATIPGRQCRMVDVSSGHPEEKLKSAMGRHDVCIGIRAVPVIEAMAAMVLLDLYKQFNSNLTIRRK